MIEKKIRTKIGRIRLALLLICALSVVGLAQPTQAAYVPLNLYQEAVLADGPLVYYPFEDANSNNGSAAVDACETHDGTYQGNTTQGQGPHGIDIGGLPNSTAPVFDGSSAYVKGTTLGNFGSQMNNGFSVEFWINTKEERTIRQMFGALDNSAVAIVIDLNRNSNLAAALGYTNFYVRDTDGEAVSGHIHNTNIYDGKWHHLAWVVEKPSTNTMRVFVDGTQQTLTCNETDSPASFTNLTQWVAHGAVGRYGGAITFTNTMLDEFAIFQSPLSQAKIQTHLDALPEYLFSYDGTYVPDTAPPLTQTTWNVVGSGYITENNKQGTDTVGFARFNDTGSSRTSIFNTFDNDVGSESWIYETRLALDSLVGSSVFLGVRDEGGSGKTLMLGWDPSDGSLGFYDSVGAGALYQSISGTNFVDSAFHTYRVEKLASGSDFDVQVYIDGVAQFGTPLSYNVFPNDVGSGNGFGYFSSTPGTSDMTMDYVSMWIIPEPSALVLLVLGLLCLAGWRRKRRK